MNLGLSGRSATLYGTDAAVIAACTRRLTQEGVEIVANGVPADIVVAVGARRPGSDLLAVDSADQLYEAWDDFLRTVDAFKASADQMAARQWGRLVWIGSAQAKSTDAEPDELGAVVTLGVLGLNKVITTELARSRVTANAVLRGGAASDDDVAAAATFLCSTGAAYLSGVTLTVDGGAGSAVY